MAACFPQSAETLQCSAAPPKFEVEFPSCPEDSTTVGPTTVTTELPTTLISTDKSTTLHSTLTSMSTTEREITSTVATEITSTVATEITSTVATGEWRRSHLGPPTELNISHLSNTYMNTSL
ncbi:uncharacterized protein [Diadema antillarum]|uniref:uncharacterized protein n=1 Tax=Diadema antillarum TaxID=105358 RepID=UPI003A88A031